MLNTKVKIKPATILSNIQQDFLKFIHSRGLNVFIGGSLALNTLGLLNREIHDIDIIMPNYRETCMLIEDFKNDFVKSKYGSTHSLVSVLPSYTACRNSFVWKQELKVDIFHVLDFNYKFKIERDILGMKFKIFDPRLIIEAKELFHKNQVMKHSEDMKKIAFSLLNSNSEIYTLNKDFIETV